jgi:hypothetical protein
MSEEGGLKENLDKVFDELIDILSELVKRCSKEIELNQTHLREFETIRYDETLGLARARIAENVVITSEHQMSYRLIRVLALVVKKLADAIDKLPNEREFDAVREELHSMNKVVKEVIVPLKQAIEETKQRDTRGDEVYK